LNTGAVKEAGLFNDVAGGIMLSRVIFSTINKLVPDDLIITWDIQMV